MLLDGKQTAREIEQELEQVIKQECSKVPCLSVVLVGEDPASQIYVRLKRKACERIGIESVCKVFDASISEEILLDEIHKLNEDERVDGILVQTPLPKHINPSSVIQSIEPGKDVDGFHPINAGLLLTGEESGFFPCTPHGIKILLARYSIKTEGKHIVVIGRSNIVGKPLGALMVQKTMGANATVTIAHSRTQNLPDICRKADILISAIGSSELVRGDWVKEGAVVVDVGMNRVEDPTKTKGYRLTGDVHFQEVQKKASAITPVPGGVGPMTIAMLLYNTVKSCQQRCSNEPLKLF